MSDPRVRTLKIKTGVVKRLAKEKVTYEKEAEQHKERIQKYKDEGREEIEIKNLGKVLQETLAMVPDCQRRLVKAYEELKIIVETEDDLKEAEEFATAIQVLEEAKLQLPN